MWVLLERDAVRLACRDFGGEGPPALLLHGLAGHAGEWAQTAGWLTERHRVLALDARGHGRSERAPPDVSPRAHLADAVLAIERIALAPVLLIGQSLGGHLALHLAAERPDLVSRLVVVEASPSDRDHRAAEAIGDALRRWPVPFESREAAFDFFGGPSLAADAWVAGLERRDGGLWPCFEVDVMVRTLQEALSRPYWREWERIRCPTLIVRAGDGLIPAADARAMADRLAHAQLVELPGASHDVHLDRPLEWRAALSWFLASG